MAYRYRRERDEARQEREHAATLGLNALRLLEAEEKKVAMLCTQLVRTIEF
jgi:hypothetical protein